MFKFKKPNTLHKPWILSGIDDSSTVRISEETTKNLKHYHINGIDFLYQCYYKQFKGAILNEENGLNMQMQVSVFLNAVFNSYEGRFLVLVLCPDHLIINWHYHLTVDGKLKVEIVKPTLCSADFDEENGMVLLVAFSNIALAEALADYPFFSVIIDDFDTVATKRITNKLCGDFNIGLTERSFYVRPDQRLQWTMLNWCNPECVGKLSNFYEIDNDNFANFRNNYRHWWFRLTWNFFESFEKISDEDAQEYARILSEWSITHNIIVDDVKQKRKRRKGMDFKLIDENIADEKIIKTEEDIELNTTLNTNIATDVAMPELVRADVCESSRDRNLESPSKSKLKQQAFEIEIKADEEHLSSSPSDGPSKEENVLLAIINENRTVSPILDHEAKVLSRKRELLTQIYGNEDIEDDNFGTHKDPTESDDEKDFFDRLFN